MAERWLDVKYANLASCHIPRFSVKKVRPYLAQGRCPLCGDSKKNEYKARFWFYENKDGVFYKCHNCAASGRVSTFLKRFDPQLYKEYRLEALTGDDQGEPLLPMTRRAGDGTIDLPRCDELPDNHEAAAYLRLRSIPFQTWRRFYYAEHFVEWVNTKVPDKITSSRNNSSRIIIPFVDEDGKVFGFQGRSLQPTAALRYISIMLADRTKVFGLDQIKRGRRLYVLEGPFDSVFFPNSVAMGGSDVSELPEGFDDITMVYDCEPRNREIVRRMEGAIDKGLGVCVWPSSWRWKDVNDAVVSGMPPEDIVRLVDDNTFKGIEAKVRMLEWKKS